MIISIKKLVMRDEVLLVEMLRCGVGVQWNLDLTNSSGDRPNLFVKSRVRSIENLDTTNLSGNDQNVRYIEVIVND